MHIKRKTIPKFWPISRSGTKYMTVATHDKANSIPLMTAMRDVLGMVKTRKELLKVLHDKKIFINGKLVNDKGYPLMLFDSLAIPSINKYYQVNLNGRKFAFNEISEKESKTKLYKVLKKTMLPGKKLQINLSGGKNLLTSEKLETGEFVVLGNDNKFIKKISLQKGGEVLVIKGKHMGQTGKIISIEQIGEDKIAAVSTKSGELKLNIETLFALA